MRRNLTVLLCILVMTLLGCVTSFADDSRVAVYMTIPAAAIDVSVTEAIDMTGTVNSVELQIDKISVTNHSAAGVVHIDEVTAAAEEGWQLVGAETEFNTLQANAKKVSFTPSLGETTWDITKPAPNFSKADKSIFPGTSKEITFTGKTGIVTAALDRVQAASIVITLRLA